MTDGAKRVRGSCLCGAIQFVVDGSLKDIIVCHCEFCQRSSTLAGAYSACDRADLTILAGRPKWYRSSPQVRRGFCSRCGSQLFFDRDGAGHMSIAAGCLDQIAALRIASHIHCDRAIEAERRAAGRSAGESPAAHPDG